MTNGSVRAETVGSLLRPERLRAMRRAVRAGQATVEDLHRAEDEAVLAAIALQEEVGLDVITDGELRRRSWAPTGDAFRGFTLVPGGAGWRWQGTARASEFDTMPYPFVTEPVELAHDLAQTEYAFLKAHARARTKFCLPAPSYHRTFWHPAYSRAAYPTVESFLQVMRDGIRALVERAVALGCDYVQLDAPNYGFACDPDLRRAMAAQGRDLAADLEFDAELDSSVFDGLVGVTRALHICRGNAAGNWAASGGYEAVAPRLFPRLRVDRLLLEFDTPRAGGFEALRSVPADMTVVLGLLTTKSGALEAVPALEARIREAAAFVPLERLALSPQCGFASVASGNPLTPAEQEAKLRRVVEVARRIWR
jgi:5-methyltetrahydropteroyltriglutamate--homocysteine methyltransferase